MKLIVGLGNPGPQYDKTRHNAGFMAIDHLVAKHASGAIVRQRFSGACTEFTIGEQKVLLLKPLRFMNCSGSAVLEAVGFFKLDLAADVLVLVDDYSLPLGSLRIRNEGSAGGHNGLSDIQRALGTTTYNRLRIGISAPPPEYDDPANWVLGKFTEAELAALKPGLDTVSKAAECFINDGLTVAMNKFNKRVVAPGQSSAPAAAPGNTPNTAAKAAQSSPTSAPNPAANLTPKGPSATS